MIFNAFAHLDVQCTDISSNELLVAIALSVNFVSLVQVPSVAILHMLTKVTENYFNVTFTTLYKLRNLCFLMAPNKPFLNFIINISNKNVKLIHICNISTFIAKAENLKFAVFVSKFLSIDFISSVHLAIFWCDKLILEKSFFLS